MGQVYDQYTDTGGNFHYTDVTTGHHIIPRIPIDNNSIINLKPCPFCGGYAHLDKTYSYFRDIVIYCEECDTVFTLDDCNATEEDIVNAWNRRAEDV